MNDLREAMESEGFDSVSTYIQSGNVIFESDSPRPSLEDRIEERLERRFGMGLVVVVRSHQQLRNVVTKAPAGFGAQPEKYHSDVIFLKAPLTAAQAMGVFDPREGVDQVWPGTGVVYSARLSERRAQSRLGRIVGTPEYQRMTIRSWNTTTKVLGLLDERGGPDG